MSGYANRTQGFKGIHDPIYVRAIVVDDGATQAASSRGSSSSCPTPSGPRCRRGSPRKPGSGRRTSSSPRCTITARHRVAGEYAKKVEDAAIEAIRLAKSRLQPARFGYGSGTAHVNVNRRELTPSQGWWLGYNENGASDKVVTCSASKT